jgi:type II secretory pathway component HofQ
MNFLRNTSVVCLRAVFAFVIISSLAFAASAQKSAQEGCKTYGCAGFVGEPINLKVVNADIRDILNYVTEQYGINFVIDNSVKAVPVTVNVNDVPWNLALDSILESQDLAIEVKGPILRVAEAGEPHRRAGTRACGVFEHHRVVDANTRRSADDGPSVQ